MSAEDAETARVPPAIAERQLAAYQSLGLAESLHLYVAANTDCGAAPTLIGRILEGYGTARAATSGRGLDPKRPARHDPDDPAPPLCGLAERYDQRLRYYRHLIEGSVTGFMPADAPAPLVMTMPIASLNAQTWRFPRQNAEAHVFNEALIAFLHQLARIVARYFPGALLPNPTGRHKGHMSVRFDRAHIERARATDFSGLQDLVNLLRGYVCRGNPLAEASPSMLERPPNFVAGSLTLFAELFAFAHELAHVAHGDLARATPARIPGLDEDCDLLRMDHAQELAADAKALLGLIGVSDTVFGPHHLPQGYWGAELFLHAVALAERAVTFARFGAETALPGDTHPPVAVRRAALRAALKHHVTRRSASRPSREEWEVAVSHADMLEELVEALWRDARSALAGAPVATRWLTAG